MNPTCYPHSKREQTTNNESTAIESSAAEVTETCADREEGRGQGIWTPPPPPLKNHKNIGFFSKTGSDPLKNHKATKPAFNVGPSLARHLNGVSLVGRWFPAFSAIWILFSLIKMLSQTFWIRACGGGASLTLSSINIHT